jgi:hypothetical protein
MKELLGPVGEEIKFKKELFFKDNTILNEDF